MAEWRSIETAPRDGTRVLLYGPEGVTEGAWNIHGYKDDLAHLRRWNPIWLSEHGCGCCGGDNYVATHWMPLPPPPSPVTADTATADTEQGRG